VTWVSSLESQYKGVNAVSLTSPVTDEEERTRPLVEVNALNFFDCFDTVSWSTGEAFHLMKTVPFTALSTSSGKHNVTVWRTSVCLSRRHIHCDLPGAAYDAASVHFGPKSTDLTYQKVRFQQRSRRKAERQPAEPGLLGKLQSDRGGLVVVLSCW